MTLYEVAGHPVSLEITGEDVDVFEVAAGKHVASNRFSYGDASVLAREAKKHGLYALLPSLLDRVAAQLPRSFSAELVSVEDGRYEYADAITLAEVNELAASGWRVHTVVPGDPDYYLLERPVRDGSGES